MTTSPSSRVSGRSSRKTVRYLAGAAMVSGGLVVGALFSPVGIAGAQSDGDTTTEGAEAPDTQSTDSAESEAGRHGRRGHRREKLTEISGLTAEQLREGFEAGQSLAETAVANGIDLDTLTAELTDAATERINEAVTEGRLTQDEADTKIAELDEHIDAMLNTTPEERQANRTERRQERRGHRGGFEAPAEDEGETVESSLTT